MYGVGYDDDAPRVDLSDLNRDDDCLAFRTWVIDPGVARSGKEGSLTYAVLSDDSLQEMGAVFHSR